MVAETAESLHLILQAAGVRDGRREGRRVPFREKPMYLGGLGPWDRSLSRRREISAGDPLLWKRLISPGRLDVKQKAS